MHQIGQRTPRRRFRFLRRIPNWQDHLEQVHDANYTLGEAAPGGDEPEYYNLPGGQSALELSRHQFAPTRRRKRARRIALGQVSRFQRPIGKAPSRNGSMVCGRTTVGMPFFGALVGLDSIVGTVLMKCPFTFLKYQ